MVLRGPRGRESRSLGYFGWEGVRFGFAAKGGKFVEHCSDLVLNDGDRKRVGLELLVVGLWMTLMWLGWC